MRGEERRGESLGGGCYDRVMWAWSSATHSVQCVRQPKAMQAAATDTTELLITPNNGIDSSNGHKINEEFGHDERKMHKTKKAINDDA